MEAFSTGDAIFFSNSLHMRGKTMLCDLQHIGSWNINAGLDTTKAHDTPIKPLSNQRGPVRSGRDLPLLRRKLVAIDSEFIGPVLELAFSSRITDRTV
jgi:hypothetical protein